MGSDGPPIATALVEADNWLSALRLARAQIGEDGGVPSGASCVMSASGDVTILDAVQRRRYQLARHGGPAQPTAQAAQETTPTAQANAPGAGSAAIEAAASAEPGAAPSTQAVPPAAEPTAPAAVAAPEAATPKVKRGSTMAYSPEQSEAIRSQLATAAGKKKRSATVAYAPEQTEAVRQALAAAAPAQAQQPPVASSAAAPQPTSSPAPSPPPPAAAGSGSMDAGSPAQPAPSRKKRSATVAYMQSPLEPQNAPATVSVGVDYDLLASRDEDPSAESPLSYRERSYGQNAPVAAADAERFLRQQLHGLQADLTDRPRGKFVNLALFDHVWSGRPERPPVATLQWKDWKGEPQLAFPDNRASRIPEAAAPTQGQGPPRTSFAPQAAPTEPASPAAAAPAAPASSSAAAPVSPPAAAPSPVPVAATPTPTPAPAPAPSSAISSATGSAPSLNLESTGEQDRRLAIAFEAAQDLYFMASAAEGLEFVVGLLQDMVPCDAASGCLYDINTDEFRFVAVTGEGAEDRRAHAVPSTVGLFGEAASSGQEFFTVDGAADDSRYDPGVDGRVGLSAKNLAYVVLQKEDNLLGMLQLINRQKGTAFTEGDAAVASYLGQQLADFLQSKRSLRPKRR